MNTAFNVSRLLLFSFVFIVFCGFDFSAPLEQNQCDNFQITVQIENNMVSVDAKNGTAPYSYLFYTQDQKSLSEEVNSSSILINSRGTYNVMVLDTKGCSQVKEFTIF
ncbi:MAG: hypothetical protein RLO81_09620 [Fulvivirga sp.]|uniref:hypothetical protein n=1 Tax=Fulvivirga sp. TaxID=1931237 RepID=UPI0032EF8986